MRGKRLALGIALGVSAIPATALAQPSDMPLAPTKGDPAPAGVKVAKVATGQVYTDGKGRTLYGLDMRAIVRAGPDPAKFCQATCAEQWEPMLAPAGATPNIAFPAIFTEGVKNMIKPADAPDWTIIDGAQGPQWVYKGWHLVFARKGDKPGSTEFDGTDELAWNTLKYVPPVPKFAGPAGVVPQFVDGAYVLAGNDGRLLFTGKCARDCAEWTPLTAGAASGGMGEWKVDVSGDTPQWTYRGAPVFAAAVGEPRALPAGATVLKP